MPVLIRFQCHACGAPVPPGGAAWVRWQVWLESPEYKAMIQNASRTLAGWGQYQKVNAEAVRTLSTAPPASPVQ